MKDSYIAITSVTELINKVKEVYASWNTPNIPWFRGELYETDYPLTPKLYRQDKYDEFQLLKNFRIKAPTFLSIQLPQTGHTDQWLFLAQHVGLPTRLLDWTEGLLTALFFAIDKSDCSTSIWMLDPIGLNRLTAPSDDNDFPITWLSPDVDLTGWIRKLLKTDDRALGKKEDFSVALNDELKFGSIKYNSGNQNIRAAWRKEKKEIIATKFPVAIHPTSIHTRITVQKSTFTIWGSDQHGLHQQLHEKGNLLQQFVIESVHIKPIRKELAMLGITKSTLFPDLDSLAVDLAEMWKTTS